MAGLVPAISQGGQGCALLIGIAGTSPAMTEENGSQIAPDAKKHNSNFIIPNIVSIFGSAPSRTGEQV
jgi:hypothetical protein